MTYGTNLLQIYSADKTPHSTMPQNDTKAYKTVVWKRTNLAKYISTAKLAELITTRARNEGYRKPDGTEIVSADLSIEV